MVSNLLLKNCSTIQGFGTTLMAKAELNKLFRKPSLSFQGHKEQTLQISTSYHQEWNERTVFMD